MLPLVGRFSRRALGAVLAAVVAACGPTASASPPANEPPSGIAGETGLPAASGDPTATYALIASQVEALRGLQPKAAIAPVIIDADQLRANLTAEFDRSNPAPVVQATEDLYVALGLLPPGTSLRTALLDLQAGQVAGYYSPDAKQLFVVSRSGGVGPTQRVTYAHEFTHQLQDQNFDLKKVQGTATDQGDRASARLALIEGDAVATQTLWMAYNLTTQDLTQILADASDPAVVAALARAPAILRTLSIAPYTEGQAFVGALQADGGEARVNAAFAAPPDSTAQVIHPDLYRNLVEPLAVALPTTLVASLGAGWTSLGQDTMGELGVRSWLSSVGVPLGEATTAAAGWAGDRIEVFAGPSDQVALAAVFRWSTGSDRTEFETAWSQARVRAMGTALSAAIGVDGLGIVVAPTASLAQALLRRLRP